MALWDFEPEPAIFLRIRKLGCWNVRTDPEILRDLAQLFVQSEKVNHIVYEIVASLNGSISAEHGLGQLKRDEIRHYKSPLEIELMQNIKRTLDPQGIMNPGKVL